MLTLAVTVIAIVIITTIIAITVVWMRPKWSWLRKPQLRGKRGRLTLAATATITFITTIVITVVWTSQLRGKRGRLSLAAFTVRGEFEFVFTNREINNNKLPNKPSISHQTIFISRSSTAPVLVVRVLYNLLQLIKILYFRECSFK